MKRSLLLVLLLASAALADIPAPEPATLPDTSCTAKQPGDACNGGGTCRSVRVRRPSLEPGATVPTWTWTEVLVCEKPAEAPSSAPRLALFAALLLALLLAASRGSALTETSRASRRGAATAR